MQEHVQDHTLGARHTGDLIELAPGLFVHGVRMRFSRNEEIFGEGEPSDYVYRVITGAVRAMRCTADGRRQITAFHLAGEIFGLEPDEAHALSAEALTECEILVVRRVAIDRAVAESPEAARALVRLTSRQLGEARDHAMVLSMRGANERVSAFLLDMFARAGEGAVLDLPMSRADIADYLALTIETVSRAFTHMERTNAIALPSSRRVIMRSRQALAEAA